MGLVLEFTGRGTRCPSCGEPMQASRSSSNPTSSRNPAPCFRCSPARGLVLIQGGRPDLGPMLRLVPRDGERADGLFPDLSR